jgi:hypothetical protein
MVGMNKNKILLLLISLFLFFIPFFWFKQGELDLGGDSSRLYFYDPIAYLHSQPLYGITTSGIGGESISYYSIPYVLLLAAIKSVVKSPTIVANILQGASLSIAFLSVYFIVKELVKHLHTGKNEYITWIATLSGIYYVLSPSLILGWDKAILTHYQFFLNPLMFLLLLKFLTRNNIKYLFAALLISFIFAANFSFVAAPPFFAFYPLAVLFLLLYVRLILKKPLPIFKIALGLLLFILIHVFHLAPHALNLLSEGNEINTAVFSPEAKFSRGLSYFSAIAPSIKVSYSLMNIAQMTELMIFSFIFIIFPVVLLLAFIWNKSKLYLLTSLFFLITLFFVTANITSIGLSFYKSLFSIPGFSMFRNYFGQWIFVSTFFYTLLFGQALSIIFEKIRIKYAFTICFVMLTALVGNALPFINGNLVNKTHHQTKNVKVPNKIDPKYEETLSYIRNLPQDGKFISFPLTGPGYQILAGNTGGAYQGPSTISYLTGKSDFTGYDGLIPFNDTFLSLVQNNDIEGINRLFALLNIKYIFYNSDPRIYDNTFPKYPYDYVRDYMPKTQSEYKKFLSKLPIRKIKTFGSNYHIYEVKNFLPHIYIAENETYATDALTPYFALNSNEPIRSVVFTKEVFPPKNAPIVLEARNINPFNELINNYHLHVHQPFISKRPDYVFYPLIVAKERNSLKAKINTPDDYLDYSLLYLSKRVFELEKYKDTPITHKKFAEPKTWEVHKWKNYYSWESNLTRYKSGMQELIAWIATVDVSDSSRNALKIKVNQNLSQHEIHISRIIREGKQSDMDKTYLNTLKTNIFKILYNYLDIDPNDTSKFSYDLELPSDTTGDYELFLKSQKNEPLNASSYTVNIEGVVIEPLNVLSKNTLIQFTNVNLTNLNPNVVLQYNPTNLITDSSWIGIGTVQDTNNQSTLSINNSFGNGIYSKKISNYKPNKQYVVSFDYYTEEDNPIFQLYEKRKDNNQFSTASYFNKSLSSKNWKNHQSIVTSAPTAIEGYILFSVDSDDDLAKLHIKNLSVVEIPNEKLFFKKIVSPENKKRLPFIQFKKLNPTLYHIKISSALNPYTLIFSEAFSTNWKLYTATNPSSRLEPVKASHFGKQISEGVHSNSFFANLIFAKNSGRPIAQATHKIGNGYANAWTISPEDVGKKENYELYLVYEPQNRVFIYLGTSVLTAISLLIYLLIFTKKKI